MACRLQNLHDKTLGIDLRGGEVLMIAPNSTSRAIVEESLYDNHNLPEWERAGWIRRLPARMDDVVADVGIRPEDPRREEYEAWRAAAKTKAAESAKAPADSAKHASNTQVAASTSSKQVAKKAEK